MIKKIVIDKFKSINHLEITPAGNFNVLIGENNIGKTTIFEAIHLWKMCYDNNLKKDKLGFYSTAHHLKFESMEFIRAYHDEDLFPIGCSGKDAKCAVTLVIEYNGQSYDLGFTVSKVSNIDDAYLQVDYIDGNTFKSFATMVAGIQGKNLANFFGINESRPIPNIVAKEPYMYKAQVLDKIAKGKGYEVLRNKVISHINEVETHIKNVTGEDFVFSESDRDDKTYISIKVNGKDIFSYGSGFLQLTEIFSSMEYLDPEIYILLIDEPDAHLHLKLQKRLIEEFRNIPNAQMFIITHNERFMEQVNENEILFLDESSKSAGALNHLQAGTKWVALEDLKGCLNQLDKLRFIRDDFHVIDFNGHIAAVTHPADSDQRAARFNLKHLGLLKTGVAGADGVMGGVDAKLVAFQQIAVKRNDFFLFLFNARNQPVWDVVFRHSHRAIVRGLNTVDLHNFAVLRDAEGVAHSAVSGYHPDIHAFGPNPVSLFFQRLGNRGDCIQVLGHFLVDNFGSVPLFHLDQSVVYQHTDDFADRGPADKEHFLQLWLRRQQRSGGIIPAGNLFFQVGVNLGIRRLFAQSFHLNPPSPLFM